MWYNNQKENSLCIFNIFKKKPAKNIKYKGLFYKFDFEKFPQLLESYNKYRELISYASKNLENKKYEEASKKRDEYGDNIFAKEVWDVFNPIAPELWNADKEKSAKWNEVFDKPFEELSVLQRRFLVGLIRKDYVYELPKEYYNE